MELHLLGHPIEDVFVIRGHLLDHIGTGLKVRQQNFAQFAGAVVAHQLPIFPDTEGDAGEDLVVAAVVLLDAQAGELLVGEGDGGHLPGHDIHRLDGFCIRFPALDAGNLANLISAGNQLGKLHRAAGFRGAGVGPPALDVLDLHDNARQPFAGVAVLLHAKFAEGVVVKGQGGGLPLLHGHILSGIPAEKVEFRRNALIDRVVAGNQVGDGNHSVHRGEHPDSIAVGADHLKNRAVQQCQGAGLPLDDGQISGRCRCGRGVGSRRRSRVRGGSGRGDRIGVRRTGSSPGRDRVRLQGLPGVRVHHILLQGAIFASFLANRIKYGIIMDICRESHLHAPAGTSSRDKQFKLPAEVGPSGGIDRNPGDILVVHVGDPGASRDRAGVGEGHVYQLAVHPRLALQGVDLLEVIGTVDGDGVGFGLVWGEGDAGIFVHRPAHTVRIDFLRRRQDPLGRSLVRTAGIDLEVLNIPAGNQVAPEGHFSGVVRLLGTVQAQRVQGTVWVAAGDSAGDLGVCGLVVRQILDAAPGGDLLGHPGGVRVDAVGRDLLGGAVRSLVVVVGVGLGPGLTVDGEIVHLLAAVVDVHLAQGVRNVGRRQSGDGEDPQHREKRQEQCRDSSFHVVPPQICCKKKTVRS